MPRVNDRRVAHKSTGGIPPKIPTPVGSVGNAPNHLTTNTVALSATESRLFGFLHIANRDFGRVSRTNRLKVLSPVPKRRNSPRLRLHLRDARQ
jgi:hypothetical protein